MNGLNPVLPNHHQSGMHCILRLLWVIVTTFFPYGLWAKEVYPKPEKPYTKEQLITLLKKYHARKDTTGLAFTYLTYAKNQETWDDPKESPVESYRKSMELFMVLGDSTNYYEVSGALGFYFMERPILRKYAYEYLHKAVDYFRRSKQPVMERGHLINLSNLYVQHANFERGLSYLQRADTINKRFYDEYTDGRIQGAYSDYYRHAKNYSLAIHYAEKSWAIGQKLHIPWMVAVSYFYQGACFSALHDDVKTEKTFKACLAITESTYVLNPLSRAAYDELKGFYVAKKDFKSAYFYADKYRKSFESSQNSKVDNDIRSFKEDQLIEQQQAELAKVNLKGQLAQAELTNLKFRQRLYIVSILFGIGLLCILAYAYVSRQRYMKLQAAELAKNRRIESLNALINGQELERLRISQELHDGLGTLLSRIKMQLESDDIELRQATSMLDEACVEVRTISGNLQPNTLKEFGLIQAIQDLVLRQHSTNPVIIFQYFGDAFSVASDQQLMIYRIVQELLANALKYAQAKEILVQLVFSDEGITLTIEDDGIGFEEASISVERNGWRNIRSRVDFLKGTIHLHSALEEGTSVTIQFVKETLTQPIDERAI